eukprot:7013230-Prymnesium_polylepis.1
MCIRDRGDAGGAGGVGAADGQVAAARRDRGHLGHGSRRADCIGARAPAARCRKLRRGPGRATAARCRALCALPHGRGWRTMFGCRDSRASRSSLRRARCRSTRSPSRPACSASASSVFSIALHAARWCVGSCSPGCSASGAAAGLICDGCTKRPCCVAAGTRYHAHARDRVRRVA